MALFSFNRPNLIKTSEENYAVIKSTAHAQPLSHAHKTYLHTD